MAIVKPTEPHMSVRGLDAGSRSDALKTRSPLKVNSGVLAPVREVPYAHAKRILDVVGAVLCLILFSWLLALVAILVKLTSRGPVIFKQTRVGVGGRHFTLYKFRSMCVDAEARRVELLHLNEAAGPVFKIKNDPRLTTVGRIIRKYSVDELPQLVNVLIGDMSLVGPRPPVPHEVAVYGARELQRLSVKPGLTCLWQVNGRSNIDFDHWMELDLLYIETMSLWNDLRILARTIPAVISARGAH